MNCLFALCVFFVVRFVCFICVRVCARICRALCVCMRVFYRLPYVSDAWLSVHMFVLLCRVFVRLFVCLCVCVCAACVCVCVSTLSYLGLSLCKRGSAGSLPWLLWPPGVWSDRQSLCSRKCAAALISYLSHLM